MEDVIVIGIVLLVLAAAVAYIVRAKKAGAKCIGCPAGCKCTGGGSGVCSCGTHADTQDETGMIK